VVRLSQRNAAVNRGAGRASIHRGFLPTTSTTAGEISSEVLRLPAASHSRRSRVAARSENGANAPIRQRLAVVVLQRNTPAGLQRANELSLRLGRRPKRPPGSRATTDDAAIFQGAFRQRSAEVRTEVIERTDSAVSPIFIR
jgi:hypothetical protein